MAAQIAYVLAMVNRDTKKGVEPKFDDFMLKLTDPTEAADTEIYSVMSEITRPAKKPKPKPKTAV